MLLWLNLQLSEESMVPDFLDIIPVLNNAALNRLLSFQHTSPLSHLVTDEHLVLIETDHDAGNFRLTNKRWEEGARGIVPCKASLGQADR